MGLLWQGIILGFGISFLMGPILFIFIQTGIEKGFRAGTTVGLGVWMSDLLYILISYFGISFILQVTQLKGFQLGMGLAGGTVLIAFGMNSILQKPAPIDPKNKLSFKDFSKLRLWLKGFLINFVNPFAAIFWMSIMSSISTRGDFTATDAALFFGGTLGMIIIMDLLKILLAKKIQAFLTYSILLNIRRITGAILVLLGFILMIKVII